MTNMLVKIVSQTSVVNGSRNCVMLVVDVIGLFIRYATFAFINGWTNVIIFDLISSTVNGANAKSAF